MVAVEHLRDEKIIVTVAIYVRKINRHGRHALVAQCRPRNGAKPPAVVIDPDAVRPVKEIVAHVNIRQTVAVDIAEHYAQAPVGGRRCERFAVFV